MFALEQNPASIASILAIDDPVHECMIMTYVQHHLILTCAVHKDDNSRELSSIRALLTELVVP